MRSLSTLARRSYLLHPVAVLGACVFVWIARRPEQLSRPYVWVEESKVLRNYFDEGWAGVFEPIQGYILLPTTVLVSLAAEISFMHLPALMYAFSLAVFIATVLLLILPDSHWGDRTTRSLMALSMALVPTNPEVFGVLLYSFWWTTLWPLIVLGWRRDLWGLRAPVLAVGALSSPAGGALFVVFALTYLLRRRLRDLISAGILLAGFTLQVVLALDSTRAELLSRDADPLRVLEQVFRTGGLYALRWLSPADPDRYFLVLAGAAFLAFLLFAAYRPVRVKRYDLLLLVAAACVYTVLSAVPAPLISDPGGGGPRYFLLPFVAFAWVLIALWRSHDDERVRTVSVVLLAMSLIGLATTFSRETDQIKANLSWQEEVRRCAHSTVPVHQIPIYFDGSTNVFWFLGLRPAHCRRLGG